MVWQKPRSCLSPTIWIPWHVVLETWRVGLYWPGEAWNQSHWWWALQGEVLEISPAYGGQVPCTCEGKLEADTICPSQRLWCNVVALLHRKDRGLWFCIDFCKLNVRSKKYSYLLPLIQEAIESIVGAEYFFCLDLKAGFLADNNGQGLKAVYCFYHGELRVLWL